MTNVYAVLLEQAIASHNPFLCNLCSTGAQARCPMAKAMAERERLDALATEHAKSAGHYLMCRCAWCTTAQLQSDIRHAEGCLREADQPTCAPHAEVHCHCDCPK